MSPQQKKYILTIFGSLLLILGILAIFNSLRAGNPSQIIWMCYISLLLMGFGILKRNTFLIMSQVYILTIPLIVWNLDFFNWIIFDRALFGITDYFFVERAFSLGKVVSMQHVFSIPLAIFATYLIGRKRNDEWKFSLIQTTIIFFVSFLFTAPSLNVNCVFTRCIEISLGFPHQINWFILYFTMILLTAFILNQLPFLKPKKQH